MEPARANLTSTNTRDTLRSTDCLSTDHMFKRAKPNRHRSRRAELSLYYAGDLHGAESCWKKFVGARKYYGVDASILGGDLTGKAIVPVATLEDGCHRARFLGEERTARDDDQLEELLDAIRFNGMYPWVAEQADIATHAEDPEKLFDTLLPSEVSRWVRIADERMADQEVATYVIAGNDDPWSIDEALAESTRMCFCDDRIVRLGDRELLSFSYANPTPWDSPRELPESELYERLRALADQLERPETAIFNLHVPPYDTGLDLAFAIDEELRLKYAGGSVETAPVGSRAVRQIIEEFQPVLSLHGHIHESRAVANIGRTLCVNPGSEYNTGRIHGVVVRFLEDEHLDHQFVVG